MLKFIFDSATVKGIVVFYGILQLLIFIGNNIEDDPIRREPWLKQTNYENNVIQKRKPAYNYSRKQPWSDDRKEQTENWADFLEEIENRGYTIFDPEAEDIWEEFY